MSRISSNGWDILDNFQVDVIRGEENNNMLHLRFDRQTYSFAEPKSPHAAAATDANIQKVIGWRNNARGQHTLMNGFNDLRFYMNLRARDRCIKTEIRSIIVYHSDNFCMGVQAIYRSTFLDGEGIPIPGPAHQYTTGYYSYGERCRASRLDLDDGEYLAQVRTRQGEITDQITLVTNLRIVSFGGSGGDREDLPVDLSRRIVAFVGTSKGVLERLGAISVLRNWEAVGHLILLRALVEKRRASRIQKDDTLTREESAVQSFLVDAKEDIFMRTLSFLLSE